MPYGNTHEMLALLACVVPRHVKVHVHCMTFNHNNMVISDLELPLKVISVIENLLLAKIRKCTAYITYIYLLPITYLYYLDSGAMAQCELTALTRNIRTYFTY